MLLRNPERKQPERRQRGFSLIELVVTLAILALLASIAVPFAQVVEQRRKEGELRDGLRVIRLALDRYQQAVVDKRIIGTADTHGYPPTLEELTKGVQDASKPGDSKIYFLRRLPRDPFFPNQAAPAADTWGKRSYESPPDYPSEGREVFDVYSLSDKVGLNGVPYREW